MVELLSLFSGIGAFEKALTNLHIPFHLVNYCELDGHASKAYSLIHGVSESLNLGDITKVDESLLQNNIDMVAYGFPCQDISIAGKQKGMISNNGTFTRSGLFFEALRIIKHTRPKIAIAENVKNLVGKFKNQFEVVLSLLEDAGYNNYWAALNAKDFELPQNRERVIVVSIRKDVDSNIFTFPQPVSLKTRMKDFCDDEVDEKYYLSDNMIKYITTEVDWQGSKSAVVNKEIASTINTSEGSRRADSSNYISNQFPKNFDLKKAEIIQVGNCRPTKTRDNPNQGRSYDPDGISPSLNCMGGGNREPHIVIGSTQKNAFRGDGTICPTLTSAMGQGGGHIPMLGFSDLRIRKLTPIECFRLMGFDTEDCVLLMNNKISNAQLYKMAGNSICVKMLEFLFCQLFDSKDELWV